MGAPGESTIKLIVRTANPPITTKIGKNTSQTNYCTSLLKILTLFNTKAQK